MATQLIDEGNLASFHNSHKDVTPFDKLPEHHKEMVRKYYINGGLMEGRVNKIQWPGKRFTATSRLTEIMGLTEAPMGIAGSAGWDDSAIKAERQAELDDLKQSAIPNKEEFKSELSNYEDIDDLAKQLQPRVKAGDEDAWHQLYKAFLPYCEAIARVNLYYYPDAANEVATDVLLWLKNHLEDWDDGTGLMTWLKYMVRNKCMNVADKNQKHILGHDPIADEAQDDPGDDHIKYATGIGDTARTPDEEVARNDEVNYFMTEVRKMLDELPQEEAQVMLLFAFEEMPIKDIMAKLGWKESKVKARLENARFYTKKWLESHPDMNRIMSFIRNESSQPRGFVASLNSFVSTAIELTESEKEEIADGSVGSRIKSFLETVELDEIELSTSKRDKLPDSSFAIPEKRAYPIHDENHARNALARVSQFGSESEKERVRSAVHKRYPGIKSEE